MNPRPLSMTLPWVAAIMGLAAPTCERPNSRTFQYRNTDPVDQALSAGLPSAGAAGRECFGDVKEDLAIPGDGS
jgi:hypothetical protein